MGELTAHKEEKTSELVGQNEENHAQMQLYKLLETKVSREKEQCPKQGDFGMVCKLSCEKPRKQPLNSMWSTLGA